MKRRDFLHLATGALASMPSRAFAQQAGLPIVGCLAAPAEETYGHHVAAIRQGLKEAGFTDGLNVVVEFLWAEAQYERLPALAAELVRRRVSVIMTLGGGPPLRAARAATSTIPIVFHLGADPVRLGFVQSMARPGGNVTGVTLMTSSLELKRLQLLHEIVPAATRIGVLVNPTNPSVVAQVEQLRDAARAIQVAIEPFEASNARELAAVFDGLADRRVDALMVLADVFFTSNSAQIAALSERYRVPTIAHSREFAVAGGLMSYGANLSDAYRLAAIYVGRILKGENPAGLPIIEPAVFDFLINQRAVRSLGLTVPPTLLAAVDELVE